MKLITERLRTEAAPSGSQHILEFCKYLGANSLNTKLTFSRSLSSGQRDRRDSEILIPSALCPTNFLVGKCKTPTCTSRHTSLQAPMRKFLFAVAPFLFQELAGPPELEGRSAGNFLPISETRSLSLESCVSTGPGCWDPNREAMGRNFSPALQLPRTHMLTHIDINPTRLFPYVPRAARGI